MNEALTQTIANDYIEKGGGFCPFCGSYNLDCYSLDVEGGRVYQRIRCIDCQRSWVDGYTLNSIQDWDDPEASFCYGGEGEGGSDDGD